MGKRNQRRGKQQEYRLIEALKKMNVEVIKYYGHRNSKAGDVLAKVGKHQVRFDHKSTSNDVLIRLQAKWIIKLTGENMLRMDEEGAATPVISFSMYRTSETYVMYLNIPGQPHDNILEIDTRYKSCPITNGMLIDNTDIKISFDDYVVYVCSLINFIKRMRHYG